MSDLLLILTPVLLSDVANPVLFALLVYLAAADRGALLSGAALLALAGYNLAYMTPFLIVPFLTLAMGSGARQILEKISAVVERIGGVLLPLLLGGIGLFLIADAGFYFATGTGLY